MKSVKDWVFFTCYMKVFKNREGVVLGKVELEKSAHLSHFVSLSPMATIAWNK